MGTSSTSWREPIWFSDNHLSQFASDNPNGVVFLYLNDPTVPFPGGLIPLPLPRRDLRFKGAPALLHVPITSNLHGIVAQVLWLEIDPMTWQVRVPWPVTFRL
jgi:hypothetical protein